MQKFGQIVSSGSQGTLGLSGSEPQQPSSTLQIWTKGRKDKKTFAAYMSWCTRGELAIAQRLSLHGSEYEVNDVPIFPIHDWMVRNPPLLLRSQIPKRQRQVNAALKATDRKGDGAREVSFEAAVVVGTA